jgi:hypothetical protein
MTRVLTIGYLPSETIEMLSAAMSFERSELR